ncbi:MAG: class I SAM-dependent methyltransferase [Bacteroidetes bacterium]|nr:class I SAM-dependent methyltransferase [Bacteroidota bacterium]
MSEWFKDWFDSRYYHLLYEHRNETEAVDFVNTLCDYLSAPPEALLLDLACGKGRHAKQFARRGFRVTGADLSLASIEAASKEGNDMLEFVVHDMRNLFRINYFDIICNLFTSFGYFRSKHDHILAARSIASGLRPGGTFVFDFVNQAYAFQQISAKPSEKIEKGGITFEIERTVQGSQMIKSIRFRDGDHSFHFEEKVNSFSKDEAIRLFESVGLHWKEAFGSYQLQPYDESGSPRMILIFEK